MTRFAERADLSLSLSLFLSPSLFLFPVEEEMTVYVPTRATYDL